MSERRPQAPWWQRLFGAGQNGGAREQTALPAEQPAAPSDTGPAPEAEQPGGPGDAGALAGLERQMARLGREQFRLNTLIEAQQRDLQAATQRLREQEERSDRALAELAARRGEEQAEARLQVIERLLPVLDGLDRALQAAQGLQGRLPAPPQRDGLPAWVWLLGWPLALVAALSPGRAGRSERRAQPAASGDWQASYAAWLQGLEMVRERLLAVLAQEDVQPIPAQGRPFDPDRHEVVDTVPAGPEAPTGTVVAEVLRGYTRQDRILRYAQVIVAR